jgi:hypothetical protein
MTKRATTTAAGQVSPLPPHTIEKITSIKPFEANARVIPQRAVDLLAQILQRFGWKQPLVVDRDGVLVAGHTRLLAAKQLGLKEVPVVRADDLTPEEVDAYRIADNRSHDFTSWDFPVLVDQLDVLAPDFSDVLALADWETIVTDFEDSLAGAALGDDDDDEPADPTDLGLSGDAASTLEGFELVVCFKTKDHALAAEQTLIDLPGAFDVRHKF